MITNEDLRNVASHPMTDFFIYITTFGSRNKSCHQWQIEGKTRDTPK